MKHLLLLIETVDFIFCKWSTGASSDLVCQYSVEILEVYRGSIYLQFCTQIKYYLWLHYTDNTGTSSTHLRGL